MAHRAFLLCWFISFRGLGVLLAAAERGGEIQRAQPKKWILVRHGESVNNIVSQAKGVFGKIGAFYKWKYKEDGNNNIQDPTLSLKGRFQCANAREVLFGKSTTDDKYNLFGGGAAVGGAPNYKAVYVSPMRRTLQTAFQTFGPAAHKFNISFKALPWAHEARKSISDLASGKSTLIQFAKDQGYEVLGEPANAAYEPLQTLKTTLALLPEDWSTNPAKPDRDLPYYEDSKKESEEFMVKRMKKLQSEMLDISEDAAILVAHSGVIRWLLKSYVRNLKPDNLAMFYGELSSNGWNNVQFLGSEQPSHEPIQGLASFMDWDIVDCREGNCNDFANQFIEFGAVDKFRRGDCCYYRSTRLWVYDRVWKLLSFFELSKTPAKKGVEAKVTIHLRPNTVVRYATQKVTNVKPPHMPPSEELMCSEVCSFLEGKAKNVENVIIYTALVPDQHTVHDYECNRNGGCFLVLPVKNKIGELPANLQVADPWNELPAAVQIAVVVACRHETDVLSVPRTCLPQRSRRAAIRHQSYKS
mmetsp:Transcript_112538/g.223695  ORF Transcript_112538/g.223695 Transcript_112538/m.223695 type:complete len:528 (+) Transcript_112538:76-1659(+)